MKKCISIILLSVIVFLTSCENFLESRDKSVILEEKLFTNQEGAEEAMYGLYMTMSTRSLYGAYMYVIPDLMGQYYTFNKSDDAVLGNMEAVVMHKHDAERPTLLSTEMWMYGYFLISNINKVIENLDGWTHKPLRHFNLYYGECCAMRAMMHFDLLRLFGSTNLDKRGIPYVDSYGMYAKPFSKTGEVYDRIIADLMKAQELLQEDEELLTFPRKPENTYDPYISHREFHANLYAVKATLARVYYTRGSKSDLDSAAHYAKQIIDSKKFNLPTKGEDKTTIHFQEMVAGTVDVNEAIFGLYKADTYTEWQGLFLQQKGGYEPAYPEMYNMKPGEEGFDFRSIWIRNARTTDGVDFGKRYFNLTAASSFNPMSDSKGVGISGNNIIRVPEMYLILAEAYMESNPAEALKYYNEFISSRGLREVEGPVTTEMLDEQLWKEYAQEGHYWFRLKKRHRPTLTLEPGLGHRYGATLDMDESKWNLKIPDGEFEFRPDGTF